MTETWAGTIAGCLAMVIAAAWAMGANIRERRRDQVEVARLSSPVRAGVLRPNEARDVVGARQGFTGAEWAALGHADTDDWIAKTERELTPPTPTPVIPDEDYETVRLIQWGNPGPVRVERRPS